MTPQEMIEVIQAYERGEKIEVGNLIGTVWHTEEDPRWNFMEYKYRIVPKPKQTKKIKLLAYLTGESLVWKYESAWMTPEHYIRVPSEDKEIQVEIE